MYSLDLRFRKYLDNWLGLNLVASLAPKKDSTSGEFFKKFYALLIKDKKEIIKKIILGDPVAIESDAILAGYVQEKFKTAECLNQFISKNYGLDNKKILSIGSGLCLIEHFISDANGKEIYIDDYVINPLNLDSKLKKYNDEKCDYVILSHVLYAMDRSEIVTFLSSINGNPTIFIISKSIFFSENSGNINLFFDLKRILIIVKRSLTGMIKNKIRNGFDYSNYALLKLASKANFKHIKSLSINDQSLIVIQKND